MYPSRMSDWAIERRLDYIDYRLLTAGSLRRGDIMRTFGVSEPQASKDINEFLRLYSDAASYDKSAKQYVSAAGYLSRRGIDEAVLRAIRALSRTGHPAAWI